MMGKNSARPSESVITQVNGLVYRATEQFNAVAKLARGLEMMPLIGPVAMHARLGSSLDTLRCAIDSGYIPGERSVRAWKNHDLVTAFSLIYHPRNRDYFASISTRVIDEIKEMRKDPTRVSTGTVGKAEVFTAEQEVSVSIDHALAAIPFEPEWGNQEKAYWLAWHEIMDGGRRERPSMGWFAYSLLDSAPYRK